MDQEKEKTSEAAQPAVDLRDLGFGTRVSSGTRARFLNRDGSYNVKRIGVPRLRSLHWFHVLITISWTRLYLCIAAGYLAINVVFATAYLMCGREAISGITATTVYGRFVDCFFFSVQTIATIGYGGMHPAGIGANLLVMVEALVGLCGFAFATALIFARFSRPVARVIFSDNAVIAPYHGITAFEFRIINMMHNELLEVSAEVTFSRLVKGPDGQAKRRFDVLALEREKVAFFPLHWTIVHPITEQSPLWRMTQEEFQESEPEFIILLRAVEETYAQQVYERTSYRAEEVLWGGRFTSMFEDSPDGVIRANMRKLSATERVKLG